MRCVFAIAVFFVSTTVSRADQPAIVNTLSPAEIAEGWILLFDGKTTFGWDITGEVKIEEGQMILGDKSETRAQSTCSFGPAILRISYTRGRGDNPQIAFQNAGPIGMATSFNLVTAESRPVDVGPAQIGKAGDVHSPATPVVISVPKGKFVAVKSVKLRPMQMTSLFNGKDLTGWHAFQGPDQKSKFSVSPEGTLHIENGKGDLQTDGKWADFLMQIECKTNANGLNSGVFFRCRPNEYQNGYEAQIQNSFGPEKEYTVDRYDPKTNALLGKDKVKNSSVDYGTGAIYRRIPARMQAAKDKEWCTMTIMAEGKHLAVWVNGLMVTDWTDNRPLKDNARNGCKLEAGHISLQGHDPTTNLDFRNIRIVDLGKK